MHLQHARQCLRRRLLVYRRLRGHHQQEMRPQHCQWRTCFASATCTSSAATTAVRESVVLRRTGGRATCEKVTDEDTSGASAAASPLVVLLLGWLGARPSQVQHYARLFRETVPEVAQGPLYIVSATCPPPLVLVQSHRLPEYAEDVLDVVCDRGTGAGRGGGVDWARRRPRLLMHVMSNGGYFVYEQLVTRARLQLTERVELCGSVFDSCPADLTPKAWRSAVAHVPPPAAVQRHAPWLAPLVLYGFHAVSSVVALVEKLHRRREIFWEHCLNDPTRCSQLFLYSSVDSTTDAAKIDELIEHRASRHGVDVTGKCFPDSPHVLHLVRYPEEYRQALLEWLRHVFS